MTVQRDTIVQKVLRITKPIHVQLEHTVYTQISKNVQTVRIVRLEDIVQALLKQQTQETARLATTARLELQQLRLLVHRAGAMVNVLDITSVQQVSVLAHHLYLVSMIRQ